MYAGTTFRRDSGRIIGVHQKIDRVARRYLKRHIPKAVIFPSISQILHFEGKNGPDGIKRKSPSVDEPWHFIDPSKPDDRVLLDVIADHIFNLKQALETDNTQRAAFEAAWLAHAVVDGLTPAHHYPLDDKIEELWGKPHHERSTIKDKNFIQGNNRRDTIAKNWDYWGAGGVFTAHLMFEWGVATVIAPEKFVANGPSDRDIARLERDGFESVFMEAVHKIDKMKMYDKFGRQGWTRSLADKTKKVLVPEIINTVCLAWYEAARDVQDKAE